MDRKSSNTYLLLSALLLIFLCSLGYRAAIEPHMKLKEDVRILSAMGDTLSRLNSQLRNANRHAAAESSLDSTEKGFAGLVALCRQQGVVIVKNKPVEVRSKADLKDILIVDLEGGYISLIRVLHQIESSLNLGQVVSTSYSTQFDMLKKRQHLILRLVFAVSEKSLSKE
ncbi:hypothetical protein [uncultured Acetobacteroides sp.]|uniref:hypothetical protein n=1 Tax=uncultured Acetobacteroides sp. TaxID=1760811 RepID=UPI0029F5195B|nr:hypothetical protein [uncultured Acetobacteroides sp.]